MIEFYIYLATTSTLISWLHSLLFLLFTTDNLLLIYLSCSFGQQISKLSNIFLFPVISLSEVKHQIDKIWVVSCSHKIVNAGKQTRICQLDSLKTHHNLLVVQAFRLCANEVFKFIVHLRLKILENLIALNALFFCGI